MTTGNSTSALGINWQELYRTALLEIEHEALPRRIAEAEKALILRAKELFSMTPHKYIDEELAVQDALYALRALRNSVKLQTIRQAAD